MKRDIKCIIIDDELKSIEVLAERLQLLFPAITIADTFTDWKKGLEKLRTDGTDILFLDISMPQKSGIDFLKLFPKLPFQVIFITAHSDFALEAIKFSAAGYVLKPIDDYELSYAVNKALEHLAGKNPADKTSSNISRLKIGIPNTKGVDYLKPDDILYFESVNKYTKVVTREFSILSSYNLGEFKKILEDNQFMQVHRSYIVNMQHIKRYETSGTLVMEDNMQIPISKNERAEFISLFNKVAKTAGTR